MEKNVETVETTVKSSIDFKLTKEDIILVAMADKEAEMTRELDVEVQLEEVLQDRKTLIESRFCKEFVKFNKLEEGIITNFFSFVKETYDYDRPALKVYNINYLSSLKNPKRAKDKMSTCTYHKYELNDKAITLSKHFEIDGYDGNLTKKIQPKYNKKCKTLLAEHVEICEKLMNKKYEISLIQYNLLILDTDTTIKANMIRKIVGTTDLSGLLELSAPKK